MSDGTLSKGVSLLLLCYIAIFMIDAVHILLLMRFCTNCIGKHRVNKKIVGIIYAAFFIVSCYLRLMPVSKKFSAANTILFVFEILFLLVVVFLFQGKIAVRLAVALLLPVIYWGLNWIILKTCFHDTFVENKQCLVSTGIAIVIFSILEFALEKWKKSKREQEREILEQEIRMYENQFEIIQQSQINTRSLKHDMKHHIKMLSDLISSGDKDAALKYLSDMGDFMDHTEKFVSSGNERIDSILNYYIEKAKNTDIHVSGGIVVQVADKISTFDTNVILSNLLDNALNALSDIPNPTLEIFMKYDRGILYINIQNNCNHEQPSIHAILSAFEPENEHGYGLKNVQRIVEKYHGNLSTECVNDVFNASILLFLSNIEKSE